MDVEDAAEQDPNAMRRLPVDIRAGLSQDQAAALIAGLDLPPAVSETLVRLYDVYRARDGELLEVNPLVVTKQGDVIALDCKFTLCDSSAVRQQDIAASATPDRQTDLEAEAAAADSVPGSLIAGEAIQAGDRARPLK